MFDLHHSGTLTLAGWLAVIAAGALACAGLFALRFARRGSARFWVAPGAIALCLLPVAAGTVFAGLGLREALAGLALTGTGGLAAISAGGAESLTPLLLGLVVLVPLLGSAFLLTAIGSARGSEESSSAFAGWALLAVALFTCAMGVAAVLLVLRITIPFNVAGEDLASVASRLALALAGALALGVMTLVLAAVAPLLGPVGPAPVGMKLASLGSIALCGVLALGGVWATWARSESLKRTALTGLRDGELPEPVQRTERELLVPVPPPPAPPTAPSRPPGRVEAYRVGGTIREPRKVRNVSPVYPDLARQARVQGVVILEATISPTGEVTSVTVLRGVPLLDSSAIEAVRQWRYEPTLLNGVAVPVIMTVTVNYKLS